MPDEKKNLKINQGKKIIFKRAIVKLVADFQISTLKGRRSEYYLLSAGRGGEDWGPGLGRILLSAFFLNNEISKWKQQKELSGEGKCDHIESLICRAERRTNKVGDTK